VVTNRHRVWTLTATTSVLALTAETEARGKKIPGGCCGAESGLMLYPSHPDFSIP